MNLFESAPAVVRSAAAGNWPKVLHGIEILQMIVFIEAQARGGTEDALNAYDIYWEEEMRADTWTHRLGGDNQIAHLKTIQIGSFDEDEYGCADPETAAFYATLTSKAPPVFIVDNGLQDGNHRVEAARQRGETSILAYVVEQVG
jgi:hypothetical protein